MNLIIILGALAAVNIGIVYMGSENYENQSTDQPEGVVEIETVDNQDRKKEELQTNPENTPAQ